MRILIISLLVLFGTGHIAFAQSGGLDLLNISPSSYALAKSEATTSIPDGTYSIYSNPALLVFNNSSSLDLSYTFWVASIQNVFGGINFVNDKGALAFAFYSSGADDYEQYNRPGPSNGNFSVQYLSLSTAYAYRIRNISLGVSAQYLREEVFTYTANGYAFNLGLAAILINERVDFGFSVNNLGEMEKLNTNATDIPSSFKIGASAELFTFTPPKNESLPIIVSVAADIVKPFETNDNSSGISNNPTTEFFNLSASFNISDAIELNTGFRTGETSRPMSFGVSFYTGELKFNYALLPFETGFGTAHSLGIQYTF
ncbi:MAG: PorV/PorQ family protein [Gracilimonas sp.]|nr:PorV/PorQ family protein [Gracilimonas sp.]